MAVDSYLNVLVYSDGIFKGSPWSLSSTNDTVETFFYDWVSFSFFLFFNSIIIFFFSPRQTPHGWFHICYLSIQRPHVQIEH